MIDTHAHIYASEFDPDREEVIKRASEQGIHTILMPNIDLESIRPMLATESAYPEICHAMMGLHPCYVDQSYREKLDEIINWFEQRDFIAVGEIGIDLYWETTYQKEQEDAFTVQLDLARQKQRPVVIHTRNSITETLKLLKPMQDGSLSGVFHCFGGTLDEAKAITDLGFHLGLGGVTTFKNGGMDKVIPGLDLSHMILETDCPYLAPVPHRGKRNEPSYTRLVAERIAELKGCTVDEIDKQTTLNARNLFNLNQPI